MKVTVIGTGKVASNLIHILSDKNLLHTVYGRSQEKIDSAIGLKTNIQSSHSLDFRNNPSSVFLIAVSDRAIKEVASGLLLPPNAIVAHTSGTCTREDLLDPENTGVFYPLQSFTTSLPIDFSSIPILIEGSNEWTEKNLIDLATHLSTSVQVTTAIDRQQLHIAAVFASNFTNRMLHAAEQVLNQASLDISLLRPLVELSISNVFTTGSQQSLTGPAQRQDHATIQNHLEKLDATPELRTLYETLTNYIQASYIKKTATLKR
ncbi:DUF2520 domain-containing protein [Reichenbachiella agarivorans]|uniref:DUF2520 domain-containing protein n=1 Tax=Reichenbachiella agarivorans TaxID=2979464 RepID=A0ABY6CR47_9BACT|nr:DUF2520 domain-containing protein [Reichenbachiella agarivorans]UXP32972.1 DUF2520 domain-containing protein [Reichenbachiella agarivorans]